MLETRAMKPLFALLLAGLLPATAAGAQAMLPALYDLSGVDSVLNVRQAPDTGAAVLGTLPARSKGIEVIARSGMAAGAGSISARGPAGSASTIWRRSPTRGRPARCPGICAVSGPSPSGRCAIRATR